MDLLQVYEATVQKILSMASGATAFVEHAHSPILERCFRIRFQVLGT